MVGLPRESRISRARMERISLLMTGARSPRSCGRTGAPALRHLNRFLHRLLRAAGADYPVAVVAVIREVPGVQTHQRHAVNKGEGDLAQGAVGAVNGDNGVAREGDRRVAGVADAGEHGELHPLVWRALGGVMAGQDADGVPAGGAGPAAGGLHDAAAAPAAHRDASLPQLPAHSFREAQRIRLGVLAADDGYNHGRPIILATLLSGNADSALLQCPAVAG